MRTENKTGDRRLIVYRETGLPKNISRDEWEKMVVESNLCYYDGKREGELDKKIGNMEFTIINKKL